MYLPNIDYATDVSFFSCVLISRQYVALETGVSKRETDVSDAFLRLPPPDDRAIAAPEAPPAVPARPRCGLGCRPTRAPAFRGAGRSRSGRCRPHAGPAAHRMRQALLEALTHPPPRTFNPAHKENPFHVIPSPPDFFQATATERPVGPPDRQPLREQLWRCRPPAERHQRRACRPRSGGAARL